MEMAFKIHKQWSVCRGGYNESSRPRRRKNKKQVAVRRAVDSILETLRNSKSIQIKRLFRTERSVSLTLNFKHVFLLEQFNDIISNIAIIESSTDFKEKSSSKYRNVNLLHLCFLFLCITEDFKDCFQANKHSLDCKELLTG